MTGKIMNTRAARKAARLNLGPLQDLLIAPKTRIRYRDALKRFFLHHLAENKHMPVVASQLDLAFCRFINALWEEGDPLAYATDALSGIQHFVPALRRNLAGSWRLIKAWKKSEIPTRAPPLLPSFTVAVASYPNFVSGESLAILLAFHCLLRTGEMLNMRWKDIHCRSKLGILTLPSTKSGTRFNIIESVPITDPFLLSIAAKGIRTHRPDNCLVCCSAAQFRVLFKKAVAAAQLPGVGWTPYSLRRGGATQHFREFGSMDATCVRGRWADVRTCRIYVNDASAAASEMKLTAAQKKRHSELQSRLVKRLRQ